jgi:hypothetical protein
VGWAQAFIVLDVRALSVRKWGQPADFGNLYGSVTGWFFEIGRQSPFSPQTKRGGAGDAEFSTSVRRSETTLLELGS